MQNQINQIFTDIKSGADIVLPRGEFEGNFKIQKPCTITGANTTLWAKNGPVLSVESSGVILKNLRIEITSEHPFSDSDEGVCIAANSNNAQFENVEVFGQVKGIIPESDFWDFPKTINLGAVPADSYAEFTAELFVPVSAKVRCDIKGLRISPEYLSAGKNIITISVDKLRKNTYLYGDIFLESLFIRRITIYGHISDNTAGFQNKKCLYFAQDNPSPHHHSQAAIQHHPSTMRNIQAPITNAGISVIERGQRISATANLTDIIRIELGYQSLMQKLDIESFAFLLDKNDKVLSDDGLVFFSNPQSKCKAVKYNDDRSITINLSKIRPDINKISIVHSVYGDNPSHNFSKIVKPVIKIIPDDANKNSVIFYPQDLLLETTIVSLEIYRKNQDWRILAVGSGYRSGLKKLCESFGLEVED